MRACKRLAGAHLREDYPKRSFKERAIVIQYLSISVLGKMCPTWWSPVPARWSSSSSTSTVMA